MVQFLSGLSLTARTALSAISDSAASLRLARNHGYIERSVVALLGAMCGGEIIDPDFAIRRVIVDYISTIRPQLTASLNVSYGIQSIYHSHFADARDIVCSDESCIVLGKMDMRRASGLLKEKRRISDTLTLALTNADKMMAILKSSSQMGEGSYIATELTNW